MYINNIHILYYVLFCILGVISSQITAWCIKRMPEHKPVISKDIFKEFKVNYPLMVITVILYLALLSINGISKQFLNNIPLIKYTILMPMLITALTIDYKYQIIPNRLNLTIFEVGLAFCFLSGFYSMNLINQALLRYGFWRRSFPNNNFNWRNRCRKRGNGIWRCQVYGGSWTLFWFCKYYYNNSNVFPFCGNC